MLGQLVLVVRLVVGNCPHAKDSYVVRRLWKEYRVN
jgi:hypothetical protein